MTGCSPVEHRRTRSDLTDVRCLTSGNHMLDVAQNRRTQKYTSGEMTRRVLWAFAQPLFRFSPRPCFGWRRFLLRSFGAKVGRSVHVYPSAMIYFPWNLEAGDESAIGEHALIYNLGPVRLGSRVTISHCAHLCAGTHDHTNPDFPLLRPSIVIGSDAWICADAFVGPGVTIGEGAVVGARAVAMKDVASLTVVVGNPAHEIKKREITQ
jgi:putative colanic acid biosynthesis acetyltransferase WcaF